MTARFSIALLITTTLGACTQLPPERQLVEDAAKALGGTDRLRAVRTLVIEGEAVAPNTGQNRMPDDELPVWRATVYKRSLDLEHGRTRVQQTRVAQFLFAGATTQRLDQSVDGAVAFGTAPDGSATRAPDAAARERRIEMLHHPIVLVRVALDPSATLGHVRQLGQDQAVDVTTATGETLTLAIDGSTKLPSRISSMALGISSCEVALTLIQYCFSSGCNLRNVASGK